MLYYMMLILIIIIFIHQYINNNREKNKTETNKRSQYNESFENKQKNEPKRESKKKTVDDYATIYDLDNTNFVLNACPLKDTNNFSNKEYVNKFLLDTQQHCSYIKPVKTIDEFHKNFFSFRDMIEQNDSYGPDPVDKMNDIIANQTDLTNKKIKDIYDEMTKGPNINTKISNRLPKFDNINYDGWTINNGSPGMYNTMNEWKYDNEKVMNGGQFDNMIRPEDPMHDEHLRI